MARVGVERHAGGDDRLAHDAARVAAERLGQLRARRRRRQRLGEQDALDRDFGLRMERRRARRSRARSSASTSAGFSSGIMRRSSRNDDAIGHDVGVDPARDEPDRHLRRADAGNRRGPRRKAAAPAVEGGEDRVRRFERVDAGERTGGVGRAAEHLDLEVQAAVVGVDDRVGEAGADREIGPRQALLEDIARADLAARLLVVGDVQFDRRR